MGPAANRATRVASPLELINRAVGIIELADHRATATDGPVGHARDNMTDAEWRQLYTNIENARDQLLQEVVGKAIGWRRRGQFGLEIEGVTEAEALNLDGSFVSIRVTSGEAPDDLPVPRTREQHDKELGIDGHTHRFTVPLQGRYGCKYRDCFYTQDNKTGEIKEERIG